MVGSLTPQGIRMCMSHVLKSYLGFGFFYLFLYVCLYLFMILFLLGPVGIMLSEATSGLTLGFLVL